MVVARANVVVLVAIRWRSLDYISIGGMNARIGCCVMSSVLLCLYYMCVMIILVLRFECKEILVGGSMLVRDDGHDVV